jgi:hypothetical protein
MGLAMLEVEIHFQLLDLDQTASLDDIKQAYRDLVMVWHPDRFAHNVRLQHKAEDKLKQFNCAYESLKQWYQRPQSRPNNRNSKPPPSRTSQAHARQPRPETHSETHSKARSTHQQYTTPPRSHGGDLCISFKDAQYILQRYRFVPVKHACGTQKEYESGPFSLWIREHPLVVTLGVPCTSLQHFDRILLSIPCKSTGHFHQVEAQQLMNLLQLQA